ncbi:MAG: hypothetical protein RIS76_1603, partial [Verrucomicrobiota bacterium]
MDPRIRFLQGIHELAHLVGIHLERLAVHKAGDRAKGRRQTLAPIPIGSNRRVIEDAQNRPQV